MMRLYLACVVIVALFAGMGCSRSPAYDPTAEPFKVNFPGTPKKIKQTLTQNGVTLQIDYTGCETKDAGYSVAFCDYLAGHVKKLGAGAVLLGARNGAAANVKGTIMGQKLMSLGDYIGQEVLIADKTGMQTRARMYLVGDRMYQVIVVLKGGNIDDPKVIGFLDSFEVK